MNAFLFILLSIAMCVPEVSLAGNVLPLPLRKTQESIEAALKPEWKCSKMTFNEVPSGYSKDRSRGGRGVKLEYRGIKDVYSVTGIQGKLVRRYAGKEGFDLWLMPADFRGWRPNPIVANLTFSLLTEKAETVAVNQAVRVYAINHTIGKLEWDRIRDKIRLAIKAPIL